MNKLNTLLSRDRAAKNFFMSLSEQEQGLLIQASNNVQSLADMKKVLDSNADSASLH